MQFTKKVRNKKLDFFLEQENDTELSVRVELPPYGSYSRGELYTSVELNNIIKEEFNNIIPLNLDGRFLSLKDSYNNVVLNFKKSPVKTQKSSLKVNQQDEKTPRVTTVKKSSTKKITKTKK